MSLEAKYLIFAAETYCDGGGADHYVSIHDSKETAILEAYNMVLEGRVIRKNGINDVTADWSNVLEITKDGSKVLVYFERQGWTTKYILTEIDGESISWSGDMSVFKP